MKNLLIKNIKTLAQVREAAPRPVKGPDLSILPVINDAWLLIKDQKIENYGTMESCPSDHDHMVIDATDRMVLPAFADSHTHLVFARYREEEFEMKIKGATYSEIAASGGGILNSAQKLHETSEEDLFQSALTRAREIMRFGTGAVEIKSGYGLNTDDELKMLRVARRIGVETPLKVKTTFLGAHAIPNGHTRQSYINLVINEMIPAVAAEQLADFIDVFCEEGFFTPEETQRILKAGQVYGMIGKVHANQLTVSGGVEAGISAGAISVDHLESMDEKSIAALGASETIGTMLPGAAFFLRMQYPPARKMIDAGAILSLATDYNPGSAPSGKMGLILSLACIQMKMTPEEAINAATINGAWAMGIQDTMGSITPGKNASIIITKEIPSLAYIPYAFGSDWISKVILNGGVAYEDQLN